MSLAKRAKIIALVLLATLALASFVSAQAKVQLTLGSWRTDDVTNWNTILAAFSQKYPTIAIKFDPTNPPDYNATLRQQFEAGIAPDLAFARTYDTGISMFKERLLRRCLGPARAQEPVRRERPRSVGRRKR